MKLEFKIIANLIEKNTRVLEGIYLFLARITTIYYFLHFIVILPALSFFEKTDPLPVSISEPVLTGGFSSVMAKTDKTINEQK